jgi:hypothetical protein
MTTLTTHLSVIEGLNLSLLVPAHASRRIGAPHDIISDLLLYFNEMQPGNSAFIHSPLKLDALLSKGPAANRLAIEHDDIEISLHVMSGHQCLLFARPHGADNYHVVPWPLHIASSYEYAGIEVPIRSFMNVPAFEFHSEDMQKSWTGMLPIFGSDLGQAVPRDARFLQEKIRAHLCNEMRLIIETFSHSIPLGRGASCAEDSRLGKVAFPWFIDTSSQKNRIYKAAFLDDVGICLSEVSGETSGCIVSLADRFVYPDGSLSAPTLLYIGSEDRESEVVTDDLQNRFTELLSGPNSPLPLAEQLQGKPTNDRPKTTVQSIGINNLSSHAKMAALQRLGSVLLA